MLYIIKYEREIDNCDSCPFSSEKTAGCTSGRTGEYYILTCTKLKRVIKKYDSEEYIKEDFTIGIPDDCPFR